jgi:hypothetical protein
VSGARPEPDGDRAGPPTGRRLGSAIGLAASAIASVALSAEAAAHAPILDRRWGLLAVLAAWSVAWGVGVTCALRLPRRLALPAVLAAAVLVRIAALAGPPTLSDDLFRYAWDARVQTAGLNPYAHPPASPELARLREPWLWPDEQGCAEIDRAPGCTRMNRPKDPTIYPPAAQVWFRGVYGTAGIEARHKLWQVAGLALDLAVVALLPALLRAWKTDERWAALYALSPFPATEFVNNGHVDGLGVFIMAIALALAARRRAAWAGAALGGATLVKLYPAVLVLGLTAAARRRVGGLLRAGGAAAVVVAVGYLPHVLAVGGDALGYLPGYLREEAYGGGRYLLAGLLPFPAPTTAALVIAAIGAVAVWVAVRRLPAPRACAALLGAALLGVTPVQPWYAVALLFVATVAAQPRWALVAAAAYPTYFAVVLDAPHAVAIGRLAYGAALVGVLAGAASTRWLEGKPARPGPGPEQLPVESPHPPGRNEQEDHEGDVLMGLLEQPAIRGGVEQGQRDLLKEAHESGAAAGQAHHQQQAYCQFGAGDEPLDHLEVIEEEANDGLYPGDVTARPTVDGVLQSLVAEDEPGGPAVDEVRAVRADGDRRYTEELGQPVGQEDRSDEDAEGGQPLGQASGGR